MHKKTCKSLGDLVTGIKHLLLEDRCSFSTNEKALLNDCIVALLEFESSDEAGKPNANLIVHVVEVLTRLLVISEHIKDIF